MTDTINAGEYFKVTEEPLSLGTELLPFQMFNNEAGKVILGAVKRTLDRGTEHVAALMDASRVAAAIFGNPAAGFIGKYVVELVFELVRIEGFKSRPSRRRTVHLFRSLGAAEAFKARYRHGSGQIYRCRVDNDELFETYMDWTNESIDLEHVEASLERVRKSARSYWNGEQPRQPQYPEALAKGRVVVADGPL